MRPPPTQGLVGLVGQRSGEAGVPSCRDHLVEVLDHRKAVQDHVESTCVLAQDGQGRLAGLAGMDHERHPRAAGDRDLGPEGPFLLDRASRRPGRSPSRIRRSPRPAGAGELGSHIVSASVQPAALFGWTPMAAQTASCASANASVRRLDSYPMPMPTMRSTPCSAAVARTDSRSPSRESRCAWVSTTPGALPRVGTAGVWARPGHRRSRRPSVPAPAGPRMDLGRATPGPARRFPE